MPAKPSGEIKTIQVRVTQKNGDIYIIERQTIYDPEKKRNKILSSKLISKIPKGSDTPVKTRPKRKSGEKNAALTENLDAARERIGMMGILEHIGDVSGIDAALYLSTDIGTAEKIISICYDYYAMSDVAIQNDHSNFSGVPTCGSEKENYFVRNNLIFQDQCSLSEFVRRGLSNRQTNFYFYYAGKESVELVMHELADFLSQEMIRMGQKTRIRSLMNPAQRIGRVIITEMK